MSKEMVFVFDLGGIAKDVLYLSMKFDYPLASHVFLFFFTFRSPVQD